MAFRVRFLPSGAGVALEPGATLHDATRRAGLPIASACGADGLCGGCALEVVEGAEHLPPEHADEARCKARNRVEPHLRLACRVRPECDVTLRASWW